MVGIAAALAGLFLGGVLPLKLADQSAVAWVEHTQQVIVAVDQLALSADDIETGQRGFLLTQNTDYLKPYQQGTELIWHQYFTARDLTGDNPRQQENLQLLADLLRGKLTELDRTITLARNGKITEALDIVRTGEGQRLMNNIRHTIGDIITEEQRLLQQRRDQAARLQQQSTLTLIALSILAIGGFLLSGIMIARMVVATRRIATETAERRRLQDMTNVAPVMMQTVDGTIRFWSEGCRRLYGWTTEQAIGRLSYDLLQTVFPESRAEVDAALLHHGAWSGELRHRASNGAEVIVTVSKTLHDYADGTDRLVVETVTDVTALRQAQTELQQNQAQFNALVDTAADGFVIARADGRIHLVNPALLGMFGYDRAEELVGQNLRVLTPVAEAHWHDNNVAAHQASIPKRMIGMPSRDLLAIRRDGSEFLIDLSVSSFGTANSRHITGIIRDATVREQTEAALRDSAAQQRDLLLTLGLGTFMARDLDGTIRYWAEGCELLYGWTAEEAVGRSAHQLLNTVFPAPLSEVEATLERDGEWKGDLRHRTRDGRELTVTAHKRLRRGENGRPGIVMEALTDVTAYRRAEAALRDSEARLRLVQQVGGIAYASRTLPEPEILISDEFVRLYGLPLGQTRMSLEDWAARLHPEDRIWMLAARDRMLESNQPFTVDFRICRPNGEVRWVTLRMGVFSDADGKPGQVVSAQQDITDIVAAREALADRQQALENRVAERTMALTAAESRFRGIFNSQSQFICLLAPTGTILEMNRSALDAAALAREDIIGRPFWENHWWPADQHDRLRQEIAAASKGAPVSREVEVRDARGRNVWIDFSLKPVHDPVTGTVIWIIAESRDQTEKHQLSAQLAQAQKMQALGQLAGGIAHDFNNILQAVSGAAMLIEQKPADLDRTRRLARATIAAARRGTSITQRLLSFARRGDLRSSAVATA